MAQPITELDSAWVALVDDKLLQMAERQHRMEVRQENLEAALKMNNAMTTEIHDILSTAKSGFKFLGWIGTAATWLVKLGAFAAATYATLKLAFPHLFKG